MYRSQMVSSAGSLTRPRESIETLIRMGDLDKLLRKAGELHGHFCPYLALGVRAAYVAVRELGVEHTLGLEELVAIVETDGCFGDGVQVVSGCTFSNNGLLFTDLGKAAVTMARRRGDAIRVAVRGEYAESFGQRFPQAVVLLNRIVAQGASTTKAERRLLLELWAETAFRQLDLPEEEIFQTQVTSAEPPPYAPIFASVRCHKCGESVSENRIRIQDGHVVCLTCAGIATIPTVGQMRLPVAAQ